MKITVNLSNGRKNAYVSHVEAFLSLSLAEVDRHVVIWVQF